MSDIHYPLLRRRLRVNKMLSRVKRMTVQVTTVLILTLPTAHGAFAQKVTVEFDKTTDFGRFKQLGIRRGQLNSKNSALNSEWVKKQIEADIELGLRARGMTRVSGPSD